MNDNKTKEMIQKSILLTSDSFTKELIEKIEVKKRQAKALRNVIIIACVFCGMLLIVITQIPSGLRLLKYQIKVPSIMIKVIGALFVFTIINKLLSLKAELD